MSTAKWRKLRNAISYWPFCHSHILCVSCKPCAPSWCVIVTRTQAWLIRVWAKNGHLICGIATCMWHVASPKRSGRQSELSRIQLDISSYATLTPYSCINSTASIATLIIPSCPQCAGQFVLAASQVIPAGTSWWRRCGIISFPWRQSRQICWHVREFRRRYTKYSQTDPSSLLSDIYIYVVWDRSKLAVKNPMIDCVIVCLYIFAMVNNC